MVLEVGDVQTQMTIFDDEVVVERLLCEVWEFDKIVFVSLSEPDEHQIHLQIAVVLLIEYEVSDEIVA